jgi:hypothetical protein
MTGLTDGRRSRRVQTGSALWLALALVGCTRLNPAFERGDANEPFDAEEQAEEAPADASLSRYRAWPVGAAPDAAAASEAAAPPFPDAAPDLPPDDADGPDLPPDDAAAEIAPGLLAYWPLDDGTGKATAGDRSGNGNDGSLTMLDPGTAWKPGHTGGAIEIPYTVGAGVTVKDSSSLDRISNAVTISAWVYRLTSIKNRNMTVLSRQVGSGNRELYTLGFENDVLIVWLYAAAPAPEVNLRATQTAPLNTWIHVAMTWDGKTVNLYQNGAPVASLSYTGTFPTTSNPVILGNNANGSGVDQPLGGRLDEVRIYDHALSASAITALAK